MKVVQINISAGSGSTGKICSAVSSLLTEKNVENRIFYALGSGDSPAAVRYAGKADIKIGALTARICGNWGFENSGVTRKLTALLKQTKPDVVHLHNLHSHVCDLETLFEHLRKEKIKVFWTFHDCWAFTGYCTHYDMIDCDRWLTGCHDCPQRKRYSWFADRSGELLRRKAELIKDVDLTVVTPSKWMAEQARRSIFKDVPVRVIYNGIDLSVFNFTQSDVRAKYGLENKFTVLGVAFGWDKRKGLDVFLELAKKLDDRYRIVLAGTDPETESTLPGNIIPVRRTEDQNALAGLYSAADVFVNPTREETLSLVNLEALACGTPVVTFRTGGSPETVDESCGTVVEKDDVAALLRETRRVCEERPFSREACTARAQAFDQRDRFGEYLALYGVE